MSRIERWNKSYSVTVPDGVTQSGEIVVAPAAGGSIKFPTGCTSPATWESKDSAGVWAAIHDDSNAVLSSAFTVDKWRPIPEAVLIHGTVRAVLGGEVTGDKTAQVVLKA